MINRLKHAVLIQGLSIFVLIGSNASNAQEIDQFQHWLELASADQTYADLADEIGRTEAFRVFLGEGSIVFRGSGPVDALEEYRTADFAQNNLTWESHYIDVSRDGDLGLTAGPFELADQTLDGDQYSFGHLVSVWKKNNGRWELIADMAAGIPGFLSLSVEPDFGDTQPVLDETAHPVMAEVEDNTMQSLIDADNLFGLSINFRGGQRALLRYGLENTRVYLPGMAPAIGAGAASSVYGAYLDNELRTTNPISLTYMGGFLSTSKEFGYTYGIMETSTGEFPEIEELDGEFHTSYLRQWRFSDNNEWRIAVEVLYPLD